MPTIEDWNKRYDLIGKEHRLKDMDAEEYEGLILSELLDLCGQNPQLAIKLFEDPENYGGWMLGDVLGKLKSMV